MDNCLVTRLKGVIANEELPYLSRCSFVLRYFDNAPQSLYGCNIDVSEPVIMTVENSYFTDSTGTQNYGTQILYEGPAFYVKKPSNVNAIVHIENKFLLTKFMAKKYTFQSGVNAVIMLYPETLQESYDLTQIDVGSASTQIVLNPPVAFGKLRKLEILDLGTSQNATLFNVNNLALNQIAAGRDYTTHPTLKIVTNNGYTRYFDGSANPYLPTNTAYIIFKSGGYELRQDAIDGNLLYDSTL